jgi:hypothetical protein
MHRRIQHVASTISKAIAICIGTLTALAAVPSIAGAQTISGDPPQAPTILLALAAQYPPAKFARSGPACLPNPIRIANDPGGNWAEATFFDAAVCSGQGNPNGIPYQVFLKQNQAGAWVVTCQARYSDVPTFAQVQQQCSAMPQAVYHVFFGAG